MKTNKEIFIADFDNMRSHIYEHKENVYYVNMDQEKDILSLNTAFNVGLCEIYSIYIDYDFSFDANLQNLIESFEERENNENTTIN